MCHLIVHSLKFLLQTELPHVFDKTMLEYCAHGIVCEIKVERDACVRVVCAIQHLFLFFFF